MKYALALTTSSALLAGPALAHPAVQPHSHDGVSVVWIGIALVAVALSALHLSKRRA